jgi:hypothetical protein
MCLTSPPKRFLYKAVTWYYKCALSISFNNYVCGHKIVYKAIYSNWTFCIPISFDETLTRAVDDSGHDNYAWSRHLGTQLIQFLTYLRTQLVMLGVDNSESNWYTWKRHLGTQMKQFIDRRTQLVLIPVTPLRKIWNKYLSGERNYKKSRNT